MKKIKAWAIVDKGGNLRSWQNSKDCGLAISQSKDAVKSHIKELLWEDEPKDIYKAVPVLISFPQRSQARKKK